MRRETAKLLHDVGETCREIDQFTAGKPHGEILVNRGLQLILTKPLEDVGEALNRTSKLDSETSQRIPDLKNYIDLRNRISHGYDSIDYSIVWEVVQIEIPKLLSTVVLLLEEAPTLKEPGDQDT